MKHYFQNHSSIFKIASIENPKNDLVPKIFEFKMKISR